MRIPTIIPMKGSGFINHGSELGSWPLKRAWGICKAVLRLQLRDRGVLE